MESMKYLTVESFVTDLKDLELSQYRILQGLKLYRQEFHHSRLYPFLGELVELHAALQELTQSKDQIERNLPRQIKEVDLENKTIVYETIHNSGGDPARIGALITWALPHMKQTIQEGLETYNFVDQHITISEVGLMPMYRQEGYWFVPESSTTTLHLLRFEVTLFTSANERFRTLKTRVLESIPLGTLDQSPEALKLYLIARYHDLPNPATYYCETDLDFPYSETLLPVAKRKLMGHLFS